MKGDGMNTENAVGNQVTDRVAGPEVAERVAELRAYVREHQALPRNIKAWELFALKRSINDDPDFPFYLEMELEVGKRGAR